MTPIEMEIDVRHVPPQATCMIFECDGFGYTKSAKPIISFVVYDGDTYIPIDLYKTMTKFMLEIKVGDRTAYRIHFWPIDGKIIEISKSVNRLAFNIGTQARIINPPEDLAFNRPGFTMGNTGTYYNGYTGLPRRPTNHREPTLISPLPEYRKPVVDRIVDTVMDAWNWILGRNQDTNT